MSFNNDKLIYLEKFQEPNVNQRDLAKKLGLSLVKLIIVLEH